MMKKLNFGQRTRTKVFIGARVHPSDLDVKRKLAEQVGVIETCIEAHGYEFHDHPFKDLRVWGGRRPLASDASIGGKTMQQRMDGLSRQLVGRLRNVRYFDDENKFKREIAIGEIIHDHLYRSFAGVFILSDEPAGCYYEIGILRQANIPCLCVSDKNNFGSVLTGDPRECVITKVFKSNDDLKSIVDSFLGNLQTMKVKTFSVRLPIFLQQQILDDATTKGMDFSGAVSEILKEHYERLSSGDQPE